MRNCDTGNYDGKKDQLVRRVLEKSTRPSESIRKIPIHPIHGPCDSMAMPMEHKHVSQGSIFRILQASADQKKFSQFPQGLHTTRCKAMVKSVAPRVSLNFLVTTLRSDEQEVEKPRYEKLVSLGNSHFLRRVPTSSEISRRLVRCSIECNASVPLLRHFWAALFGCHRGVVYIVNRMFVMIAWFISVHQDSLDSCVQSVGSSLITSF